MKRTNRYPKGIHLAAPASSLFRAPDHKYRWEHPLAINARHCASNPHGMPFGVRAKIEFALKHLPLAPAVESFDTDGNRVVTEQANLVVTEPMAGGIITEANDAS
jgi:hypothetical protein